VRLSFRFARPGPSVAVLRPSASCSKNEPVTAPADTANKAVGSTADAAAKTAEAAKAEAAKVEAARAADNTMVQGLLDKAQSLIAQSKFSDASSALQQLAGQSLSGDQQKLVDGLKE
jgi:hypothetical protein